MRDYELVVVLSPMLNQEEASAAWERIKRLVADRGGAITHDEQWGTRRLVYPIKRAGQRFTEGNYFLARFHLEPSLVGEMDRNLRLAEEVLRFLVVKEELPQPVATEPVVAEGVAPQGQS